LRFPGEFHSQFNYTLSLYQGSEAKLFFLGLSALGAMARLNEAKEDETGRFDMITIGIKYFMPGPSQVEMGKAISR
jgi:hypothetical protein